MVETTNSVSPEIVARFAGVETPHTLTREETLANLRKEALQLLDGSGLSGAAYEEALTKIESDIAGNTLMSKGQLQSVVRDVIKEEKAEVEKDQQEIQQMMAEIAQAALEADERNHVEPIHLSASAWHAIGIRNHGIDTHNEHKLEQFAATFVDPGVPSDIHHQTTVAIAHMLKSDEVSVARETYNHASAKARATENHAMAEADARMQKHAKDPHLSKAGQVSCQTFCTLGTGAMPEGQQLAAALDSKPMSKEKAATLEKGVEHANKTQHERIGMNMYDAVQYVGKDVQARIHNMSLTGGRMTDVAIGALRHHTQDPHYKMSADEKAAVEVFSVAKSKTMVEEMAAVSKSIDLELKKGVKIGSKEYEQDLSHRAEEAYAAIHKGDTQAAKSTTKGHDMDALKQNIEALDRHGVSIKNAGHMSDKTFKHVAHEAYEQSFGSSVGKAWNDVAVAATHDMNVVGKKLSDAGKAVSKTLNDTGKAIGELWDHMTGSEPEKPVAKAAPAKPAAKPVAHAHTISDDVKRNLDTIAHAHVKDAKGHDLFDMNGDKSVGVGEAMNAFKKAHVDLTKYEDKNGNITDEAMKRAIAQAQKNMISLNGVEAKSGELAAAQVTPNLADHNKTKAAAQAQAPSRTPSHA